jgi:hypothetical protein
MKIQQMNLSNRVFHDIGYICMCGEASAMGYRLFEWSAASIISAELTVSQQHSKPHDMIRDIRI